MTGSRLPAVRAEMRERFIVNMRVPVDALELPRRLRPQPVKGWAIVSFCVLDLRGITIAPLPTTVGWRSLSCAERRGVLDPGPAVYVERRLTTSRLGAAFTRLGFSAPHAVVDLDVTRDRTTARVRAVDGGAPLLDARLSRGGHLRDSVFDSVPEFARFLADGVRSYGPSRHEGRLTVLDLHKTDSTYEPLVIEDATGSFVDRWAAVGAEIDSAVRTTHAAYEWRYHGLVSAG